MNNINYEQVKDILRKDASAKLIDVRSIEEYRQRHLLGAISVPLNELESNIRKIIPNKNTIIIVYCKSGKRSLEAVRILNELGYNHVYNIIGGIDNIIN